MLKGYRTKITGWVMALAPVAAMLGYNVKPEVIGPLLEDSEVWITTGYALGGALVHYFRGLADRR
jgi:hypothetical protein